jgi:peptidoglycan/LPS O-acetylase OafA/YrhL
MKTPEGIIHIINKNNNFNFLRLLLAYIVVIHHSAALSGHKYPLAELFDAHVAVCCFFVISGFLIIRSYWMSDSLKDYFIKRCKRLLPAYFLVIIFCTVLLSFFSNLSMIDYFKSPQLIKFFLSNALFMNFLQPSLPGVFTGNIYQWVNGSLWTIKLEVCFYIIVPLLAYIFAKLNDKKRINLFLAALYIFGYAYNLTCMYISKRIDSGLMKILAHQLPGFIQYFAVGIFCAINYDFVRKHEKYLIIPGIVIVALYYMFSNDYLLPIGLGILIMYSAFNFPIINNIGKNGDYSYGVYIFHFPIIQLLISAGYFNLNKNITLLLVFGAVFGISYLSWHLLEKKVLKR